jgi:predicted Zn-dependent peptidase
MIEYKEKVLSNGLRLITAPMKSTQAVTLLVLVGVGSRYETKKINGISHFLEHLFFKGTKSRPRPGQVHEDLNRIGSIYNAFTSKETTGFWVKTATKDVNISLDIVSDILLEPLFKEEEIEKERGVILQEISMYEDQPQRRVWDIFENVMYGDQPVGWDITGTKETVASIRRQDILDYRQHNYLSKNMVVVAAGNIDSKEMFQKIEDYFGKIKKGENSMARKARISQNSPRVKIINKDSDQTHLALGTIGYDMYDDRRYTLNLLSVILGGNFSSRIFKEIREKLGLAYYVFARGDQYSDCGYLGIGAGIPHLELARVIKKINEILNAVKKEGVTKDELSFAKSYLRGHLALSMETSDEVADFCATRKLFYGEIMQPELIFENIEKVSQDDILRVANDIFRPEKFNMVAIGKQLEPVKKTSFYQDLFSKM